MNIKLTLLASFLLFCTSFAQNIPDNKEIALAERTIKVATFNIKFASLDNSPTAWPTRKAALLKQINQLNPDIIGMQEVLLVQYNDILAAKDGYAFVGCARDNGRLNGEFSPILYNTERFTLSDSGTFWLSETPEIPGSVSWDSACTRICSWARFIDKKTDKAFYFYNTHLDHQSEQARINGLKLILTRISQRTYNNEPFILTGDFNCTPDSEAITFVLNPDDKSTAMLNTFDAINQQAQEVSTFNGFRDNYNKGIIDYIMVSGNWQINDAGIDERKIDNSFASDHFPVWAVLSF